MLTSTVTSAVFWLFPIAFTLHNTEEAICDAGISKHAGRFQKPVSTFEFLFALVPITALGAAITLLFYSAGKLSIPCYLFFAFNLGMLANVFFPHLVATIALGRYCPGLATGILLLAPVTSYLLFLGYCEGYFEIPRLLSLPPYYLPVRFLYRFHFCFGSVDGRSAGFRRTDLLIQLIPPTPGRVTEAKRFAVGALH